MIAYVSSVLSRKIDNYSRLTTDNRHYYYLSPSLAYEKVQVKYLLEQLEIYYKDGRYIMTVPRMNTKPGATKLQAFLYSFANMIDDIGIDEAIKKVNTLL